MSKPMHGGPGRERRRRNGGRQGFLSRIVGLVASHSQSATVGGITGLAAGVASGAIAGTPGVVAGAVLGGAIGAAAGAAMGAGEEEKRRTEQALDAGTGVLDDVADAPSSDGSG